MGIPPTACFTAFPSLNSIKHGMLDIPYSEGSRIIEMMPNDLKFTIDEALNKSANLRREYENNFTVRKIIDLAKKQLMQDIF